MTMTSSSRKMCMVFDSICVRPALRGSWLFFVPMSTRTCGPTRFQGRAVHGSSTRKCQHLRKQRQTHRFRRMTVPMDLPEADHHSANRTLATKQGKVEQYIMPKARVEMEYFQMNDDEDLVGADRPLRKGCRTLVWEFSLLQTTFWHTRWRWKLLVVAE